MGTSGLATFSTTFAYLGVYTLKRLLGLVAAFLLVFAVAAGAATDVFNMGAGDSGTVTCPTTISVGAPSQGSVAVSCEAANPFAGIDNTGATDVTVPLNAALASLPNGTVAQFPANGQYRIEGSLLLTGKDGVTLDGNGSTFFATTDTTVRTRSQWKFNSDTNLTVENMTVHGSAPVAPVYNAALEAQHAFEFQGSSHVLLTNVTSAQTRGDAVNVGKAQIGSTFVASSFVTVSNSTFSSEGRMGWSITDADNVTFTNDSIDLAARSLIDIEPGTGADHVNFVDFDHNAFGFSNFATISDAGFGLATSHDLTVDSNHMIGPSGNVPPFKVSLVGVTASHRANVTITNNVGQPVQTFAHQTNDPSVGLSYVDNATVTGNTQAFSTQPWPIRSGSTGSPQAPVMLICSAGTVSGNTYVKPAGMPDLISRCP